ncbi:MAG TPA: LysR family transcriptional regulator [Steroidobacteraceae bacterium]|nr:LysR family transcriptional regulator [Steroidobacteraceae bacterium]
MRSFVRVVEAGSFSAVAEESDTTQSAISKQIAALERELGAKLLTRTTRSLALTEEGARYFEQARRLVAEIAEAESIVRAGEEELTGWLRVAASVGFGRLKLMPLVQSFLEQHRRVKIDLRLNDGFVDLVEQGIDVAVRLGELQDSGLVARRVGTSHRWLVAHRDCVRRLPKGSKAPRVPDDLARHNCIVYTELPWRNAWTLTAGPGAPEPIGSKRVVHVEGNLQTNSSEVIRSAVLAGMGIAFAPTWLFETELASGEVQRLLPDWEAAPIPIHLVSPRERRDSAKVKALSEHLAKAVRLSASRERADHAADA